ncbi:MAG: proton-conducting transporter membrane subunit [Clostridia bacterium]
MQGNIELIMPIALPIIGGLVVLLLKNLNKTKLMRVIFLAILGVSVVLSVTNCFLGDLYLNAGKLADGLDIIFKLDDVGRFFSMLTALIWLLTGIFSCEYFKHEERENQFFGSYLMTYGILMGIDYAGSILTLYVFYEAMTLVTVAFVIHSRTPQAVAASLKYLMYSLFGAFMGLIAIFFINVYGTTLEFTAGGVFGDVSQYNDILLVVALLSILGFGTKAGMFPLHGWLPEAHPVAPGPASAVLSGIITKSGVIALIRVVYYIFGADFIRGTWVQYTWMTLALITVIMGSVMAFKQDNLKKRLAYSTVSQVSYVLFGLSLLNATAFVGALLHVTFHAILKVALFLVAGAIVYKTGNLSVKLLKGIGKKMPIAMVCFAVAALGLVGIPPVNGFVSKWYLATGAIAADITGFSVIGPICLLCSAIFTAAYLFPPVIDGFFMVEKDETIKKNDINFTMALPLIILAVLAVVTGVFSTPLVEFFSSIVNGLL